MGIILLLYVVYGAKFNTADEISTEALAIWACHYSLYSSRRCSNKVLNQVSNIVQVTINNNMQDQKIRILREWMIQKGCRIHPHLTIPSSINGVQGIAANAYIPHKTLVVAVPSSLILTVTRCYNDPFLKKMFLANDDLFDYQATQDAQFNVLCVFMMYHKLNIQTSEWKPYLDTISQPETAIDWENIELKGLNRSMIEQIIHVRRECATLQDNLVAYLLSRKEFRQYSEELLRRTFHYCYRSVMTRCFGYYFNQACLIPIADLINHGCEAVDHQLINVHFENGKQFQEGYYPRCQKMDCGLLELKKEKEYNLPFRERFLVMNRIIEEDADAIAKLNRQRINEYLYDWNDRRLKKEGLGLQSLHFCSEDEEEDNDTDEEFQVEQVRELEHCQAVEEEQMGEFITHYVTVKPYGEVEKQLQDLQKDPNELKQLKETYECLKEAVTEKKERITEEKLNETEGERAQKSKIQKQWPIHQNKDNQSTKQANKQTKQQTAANKATPGIFAKSVPIQMIQSSQDDQQSDEEEWGLKEGAYFTMSTSSSVNANQQLYNSYGSRTNKFLLIWYGFAYQNNLHDSVSFRLQVQFGELRPASQIVLDSYIGGQGLSFRKNDKQMVKDIEVSRQFRFKRSNICQKLLLFLRLYLMNYYKGEDIYKLFVTFPASVDYELFVFRYYRDILLALYQRYPVDVIQELEREYAEPQFAGIQIKIKFKLIYLREQRKLLDLNLKAVDGILQILKKCKQNGGGMEKQMYDQLPIQQIRVIRKYLMNYHKYEPYILYKQTPQKIQAIIEKSQQQAHIAVEKKGIVKNQIDKKQQFNDEEWEDQQSDVQNKQEITKKQ